MRKVRFRAVKWLTQRYKIVRDQGKTGTQVSWLIKILADVRIVNGPTGLVSSGTKLVHKIRLYSVFQYLGCIFLGLSSFVLI